MPLIIESYDIPYTRIAGLLFPGETFEYMPTSLLSSLQDADTEPCCYTRAEDDPQAVRYYFSRIYYVENGQIVCINKTAQKMRAYDLNTGKPVNASAIRRRDVEVDKSEFLPQLMAQKGELVLFPDDEEEDD